MLTQAGEVQQYTVGVHGAVHHIGGIRGADGDTHEETEVARLAAAPARLPDAESGRFRELALEAAGEGGGREEGVRNATRSGMACCQET